MILANSVIYKIASNQISCSNLDKAKATCTWSTLVETIS
jgi:hypothetical protein